MNKIEALQKQRARAQAAFDEAQRTLRDVDSRIAHALSDVPVMTDRNLSCGTCGADVRTEALFSAHYVIPDWRYANIGHCPTRDPR